MFPVTRGGKQHCHFFSGKRIDLLFRPILGLLVQFANAGGRILFRNAVLDRRLYIPRTGAAMLRIVDCASPSFFFAAINFRIIGRLTSVN
jgi:hypothetical protein